MLSFILTCASEDPDECTSDDRLYVSKQQKQIFKGLESLSTLFLMLQRFNLPQLSVTTFSANETECNGSLWLTKKVVTQGKNMLSRLFKNNNAYFQISDTNTNEKSEL